MSRGRVLVTGASGFVGSHLAEALSRRGYAVRTLVRPTSDRRRLERFNVKFVEGDVTDAPSMSSAIAGCERSSTPSRSYPATVARGTSSTQRM